MSTNKSPERLVFFSDAVVAIALTLLVLPLTDLVPQLAAQHGKSIEAITEHQWQIYSFLLSFAVIARMWIIHHRIFEDVQTYNRPLITVNFAWLLTIAVLPFPTEMVGGFAQDEFTVLFYIGTVLVSSACLTAIVLLVRYNPEIAVSPDVITDRRLVNAVGSTAALALAFLLAALIPAVGYYGLLLLTVPSTIARRWPAREKDHAAQ
jgi:uncharacterized membrane protein